MNTSARLVTTKIAIPDPAETTEANPIHGAEGAAAAGYAGALVAGVHTYGWASSALVGLLGEAWLERGWVDVAYRRPVYAGDVLRTTVEAAGDHFTVSTAKPDGTVVLDGTAGLGEASWFPELEVPERRAAQPPIPDGELVRMLLASAPLHQDFRPMAVDATLSFARSWAKTRLDDDDDRWHKGDHPYLQPSFLAGRMTPLFRHNYRYGPAIHARSQIQHLTAARAGQELTVAARLHAVYERKGHHYHESDCWIFGADGSALTAKRHTGVFLLRPRS